MSKQIVIFNSDYSELTQCFQKFRIKKMFLVCDNSMNFLSVKDYFKQIEKNLHIEIITFSDFQPNPLYESVVEGVKIFCNTKCDSIMAVGGGSAIDVAKCIKLYANMNESDNYLSQIAQPNNIPFLVMPTTAGTGSEATKYAVIYYNGEKQSITDESIIPSVVVMDASVLKTLPDYQKKSTMLDALCHSIESFWSVNSTDESKIYSAKAIRLILNNIDSYLNNDDTGNMNMLLAANLAGKAINITQTTAGHAMCYKLTSLYGIAHGHAAALCVNSLFPYMIHNIDKCIDCRGTDYLTKAFEEIAKAMGCENSKQASEKFSNILSSFHLDIPLAQGDDLEILTKSVNTLRLKNNPIKLDKKAIYDLYMQILT